MKHSSGRARGATPLFATTPRSTCGASSRPGLLATLSAAAGTACCALALMAAPGAPAFAQKTPTISHGPAVRDATPDADASIEQKNWTAALAQLDARIAANPRDAQARFKRATVLARLNRDDDAIAAFTELTQTYPELPEPYNNLAALYAKQGRYTEARAALETAVKASPGYGLAYENLGDLYLRMADQAYRRAQSLGAGNGTTSQRIADIEKIVSPRKAAVKKTSQAAPDANDYTNRATSNITNTPGFQFGGPNGSLAIPPYVAPSQ
ncbi:tetratricopeptide repeat protein [Paraburkholderia sp. LEh10]|uniref:tetratricopeptide repeat protein n=1 Tax=Paraburkholderia sp. LEh10 TaxID=2821353 RepID=UPI001AE9692A|nr:tetratricopeptide repeat protein [Paraburkholderia sp. LEh10]MBP0589151.1 tetratricopeptide repeat protein [Paraburkholderia sp. LEh10]